MNSQDGLAANAALFLLAEDLKFHLDFALSVRVEPIRSVAFLALMPFVSAFVFDSATYLGRQGLVSFQALASHEDLLRTSRQRLKLVDDNRRSLADILEQSARLTAINSRWFSDLHSGVFGPLKRWHQTDLGIYSLQGEIICTTHVAFLNMGLTEDSLARSSLSLECLDSYLHSTSIDLGRYMGFLRGALGLNSHPLGPGTDATLPLVQYRDIKSKNFYGPMARRIAPKQTPVCILLTSILCQVNAARVLVPLVDEKHGVAAFKIRFLSLFHAISSLQKLLNEHGKGDNLRPDAGRHIGGMLGTPPLRTLRKHRGLRNNLMHYGVDERVMRQLSPTKPLFGLVEAQTSGKSLVAVAHDVETGLALVSDGLCDLLFQPGKRGRLSGPAQDCGMSTRSPT